MLGVLLLSMLGLTILCYVKAGLLTILTYLLLTMLTILTSLTILCYVKAGRPLGGVST